MRAYAAYVGFSFNLLTLFRFFFSSKMLVNYFKTCTVFCQSVVDHAD